jgi:metal-responsive CopG/Arc/MetJ family transcriptional regulator
MNRAVKFAVSLPDKDFQELEKFRKKRGLSRSKMVLDALRHLRESAEKEKMIKSYVEGYKKTPEQLQDVEGWEKAEANVFSHGEW